MDNDSAVRTGRPTASLKMSDTLTDTAHQALAGRPKHNTSDTPPGKNPQSTNYASCVYIAMWWWMKLVCWVGASQDADGYISMCVSRVILRCRAENVVCVLTVLSLPNHSCLSWNRIFRRLPTTTSGSGAALRRWCSSGACAVEETNALLGSHRVFHTAGPLTRHTQCSPTTDTHLEVFISCPQPTDHKDTQHHRNCRLDATHRPRADALERVPLFIFMKAMSYCL